MARALFGLLALVLTVPAAGQDVARVAARHARIEALYAKDDLAGVIREVELQVKEVKGTIYADSLHRYLYKYGRACRKLRGVAEGIAGAERIHALVKERHNAAHEIDALFDLSWIYYEAGEMKQCARVDSMAVVVADGDPSIPFTQRGRARQYLSFDHGVIGDHRASAKWALEAIAQYEQADTVEPAQLAEAHTAVGSAYWHLGRIRDAEAYYLKALAILGDRQEEPILVRKVSTYGNLGVLWQNAGDLARARGFYETSLRLSDRVIATTTDPFVRDEAIVNRSRTYLNIATIYHQLGDHGRARELLGLAYRDRSGVLQPDDPQLLVVQDRLADVELSAGDLDKAATLTSTYLNACERKFGRRSEEYVRAASKLGDIAERKGELARADSLFTLSIAAGTSGGDASTDMILAQTLLGRARLHTRARRSAAAMADLQRARAIIVRTYDSSFYKVADADIRLAEAAFEAGDPAAAHAYARSAWSILGDRVQAARSDRATARFQDPHLLPDAAYWLIRSQRALHPGTVRTEWIEWIDLAIRSLSRNKLALEDDASKLQLIAAQERLFDLATDLAFEACRQSGSEKAIERFLQVSEADRSILLKGRLNAFAGIRFAGVPDSIIVREQELIASLTVDQEDRSSLSRLDALEKEYAGFVEALRERYPAYYALRYGEATVALSDVRARLLEPGRQLVAYTRTGSALFALVIGPDTARAIRLDASDLAGKVNALNAAIAARDPVSYIAAARQLDAVIRAPLEPYLGHDELLIIPDGELHLVNFETLITGPVQGADFREQLLIQRHAVAYLLSATTAIQFADLARDRSTGTLALAPGFTEEMKKAYLAQVHDTARVDKHFLELVRQPFAMRTAERLGSVLDARVMLGADASERGFRGSARQYGILHLGTHAELNESAPMYSRLVLSKDGEGRDPDGDGYLYAYEIYELDLRAELAVLTACETGIGRNVEGEGVRSLGYGFAYAGCPSMVTSLWSIDEKVSSEIIADFYRLLADGLPKHLALRQAKLDHLAHASEELMQPYYWAGQVLVGDVAPIHRKGRSARWIQLALAGLAAIAVFALFLRSRRS